MGAAPDRYPGGADPGLVDIMETKLELVLPDARHRADVLGFYDEFRAQGETCIGYGGYEDFDAWLTGMRRQSDRGTTVFSAKQRPYRLCCPPLRIRQYSSVGTPCR